MGDRQWFILYVLVCLEVGLFLALVPWSAIWERNYFLEAYPSLRPFLLSPSVKGAVAGLGLANIYLGLSEVVSFRRGARLTNEPVGGSESLMKPRARQPSSSEAGHDGGRSERAFASTEESG